MRSLIVYVFEGKHYIALLGGSQGFETKEQIFTTGKEKEVFTISENPKESTMEMVRRAIAEADRRGIRNVRCFEDIFASRSVRRANTTLPN